jgi:hypothetical protein
MVQLNQANTFFYGQGSIYDYSGEGGYVYSDGIEKTVVTKLKLIHFIESCNSLEGLSACL